MHVRSFFVISFLFLLTSSLSFAGDTSLKVIGDNNDGYSVIILYKNKPLLRHNNGGEFTAVFENEDRSIKASLENWKASRWEGDSNNVTLYSEDLAGFKGQLHKSNESQGAVGGTAEGLRGWTVERANLKSLYTNVNVKINYTVVNDSVVRKTITFFQTDNPVLFYRINNRLEAIETPESYWSFENENPAGGSLHQIFPAAGFRFKDGTGVGLLTDAGYKNLWTGADRRRNSTGMTSLAIRPDVDLLKIATKEESSAGKNFVEFNFGQVTNYKNGFESKLTLPVSSEWKSYGDANIIPDNNSNVFKFKIETAEKGNRGIIIPLELNSANQYLLTFKYRGSVKQLGLRLWNAGMNSDAGGLYSDTVDVNTSEWRLFTQVFTPSLDGILNLHIGRGYHDTQPGTVELKDIQIAMQSPSVESYHPLTMGTPAAKTLFIFIEPKNDIHTMRLASEVRLSEGLGFQGTEAEKILYATQRMLCWITEPGNFNPLAVPSLSYSPDSYMRDAMWIILACHDKNLSEKVLKSWGATQDERGCIDTIITPYMGSLENVDNDSTFYYLLWSYANYKRYGLTFDNERIKKALAYCRSTWDPERTGVIRSRTPAATDTMWLDTKIVWSDNQGVYYNVLRACKVMGLDVTQQEIDNAKKAYNDLYKPEYGYVVLGDGPGRREIISPGNLIGEFVSWWLWNEPLLTDEAVINTLDKLPPTEYGVLPGWAYYDKEKNYVYFSESNHPFSGGKCNWQPGVYTNGGSWLLYDYMAYAVGLKHGWAAAKERMQQRLDAQFKRYTDWPVNFEWTPTTKESSDAFPPEKLTKVFGWDTFILIVNEVVGLRNPEQDPDYSRN
jgi:hypothetical protein